MEEVGIKTNIYRDEFNRLSMQLRPVFYSELGFTNAKDYIKGLLGPVERKNGWQLAEYLGEANPYRMQQFLYRGQYSADELRDVLRKYIGEELGEEDGVMVIDDTFFIKKGKKSCGVKRQYSGTAGKIENCQIGVFLTYASSKGHSPIDRRLYLPEEWIEDKKRLKEAGVPEKVTFQTKPQMGLEMIQEATAARIAYKWVTGDCAYGDYREIRQWLEKNGKCYVMCVSGKEYIWEDHRQVTVASVLKNLQPDNWFEASCGDGSKGARIYDWQSFEIESYGRPEGWKRVMLVRRSQTDHSDIQAHICYAPKEITDDTLVEIAGARWTVESCFQESKSEVGLDHYEVRSYDGWYKHITFSLIALVLLRHCKEITCSFDMRLCALAQQFISNIEQVIFLQLLTVLSSISPDSFDCATIASSDTDTDTDTDTKTTKTMQQYNPGKSSLEDFKKKRNLRV